MATARQKAANRANAQNSTGPRTPEGKAKSSLNAVSHGFAAATHFIDGEDPDEFYGLQIDLIRELQPATHLEQILVEKMVHNQWLSLRAIRLQSNLLRYQVKPCDGRVPNDLGLLIRYQTASDRAFHKAHAELLKVQEQREKSQTGFVSQDAGQPAAPAPTAEIESTPPARATTPEPVAPPEVAQPEIAFPEIALYEQAMAVDSGELPQAA